MLSIAEPLSADVTPIAGPFDIVAAPDAVRAGDMLLVGITSSGPLDSIAIEGGNPWTVQGESSDQFNTRWFAQIAGILNPSSYAIDLGDASGGGDEHTGLVSVLHLRGAVAAGLLLVTDSGTGTPAGGVPCPDASPGVAGGVEVRYVVGHDDFFAVGWEFGNFPVESQDRTDVGGALIGADQLFTSADVPLARIEPLTVAIDSWQAWTIVVPAGDFVPPPPPVPAFASKGRALFRYTAHDLLTGTYIDDLYPRDVSYDKRIGEPGAFTGQLPIPNARVAAAVRRVIPKLRSDLTTGPGRVEIRIWRDGVLQPRYWLTGARLSRGRDGKIVIDLRGSTLDAYWHTLRIRSDEVYPDSDIVAGVRTMLESGQAIDGANLGILFATGTMGLVRPVIQTKDKGTTYGRAAQEESRTYFEWTLNEAVGPDGVETTWVWGAPKLGTSTAHVFSSSPHGGDIAEYAIDIDALRGAGTDVEVRGGTPDTDATEDRSPVYSAVATTPHRAAGFPRIDKLLDHPQQSRDQTTLDDYAQHWADTAGGPLWVHSVTVYLSKDPSLTMQKLGDLVRLLITDVWYEREDGGAGLDMTGRVIGMAIKPTGKGRGREEAQLILETTEVP